MTVVVYMQSLHAVLIIIGTYDEVVFLPALVVKERLRCVQFKQLTLHMRGGFVLEGGRTRGE